MREEKEGNSISEVVECEEEERACLVTSREGYIILLRLLVLLSAVYQLSATFG